MPHNFLHFNLRNVPHYLQGADEVHLPHAWRHAHARRCLLQIISTVSQCGRICITETQRERERERVGWSGSLAFTEFHPSPTVHNWNGLEIDELVETLLCDKAGVVLLCTLTPLYIKQFCSSHPLALQNSGTAWKCLGCNDLCSPSLRPARYHIRR